MLVVRFPGGGNISIEFVDEAADAAWMELRSPDPEALMQAVVGAGLREVKHPGHAHYFMAPGGQVFTIVASLK